MLMPAKPVSGDSVDTSQNSGYDLPVAIMRHGIDLLETSGIAATLRFFYAKNSAFHYVGLSGAAARLAGARAGRSTSLSPAPMIDLVSVGF